MIASGILGALLVLVATAGLDVDAIAAAVEEDGVWTSPEADLDAEELRRRLFLGAVRDVGVVVVGPAPADGEQALADAIVERTEERTTILVRSREGAAAASVVYNDAALDRAIDAAFDELRTEPVEGIQTFMSTLVADAAAASPEPAEEAVAEQEPSSLRPAEPAEEDEDGGGAAVAWVVAAAVVIVTAVRAAIRRGRGGGGTGFAGGGYRRWASGRSVRASGFRSASRGGRTGGRSIRGRSSRKF